jgi:SprT protein
MIRQWINESLYKLKIPLNSLIIHVEWNNKFVRRIGDAIYYFKNCFGIIRLSTKLWPLASASQRKETVVHELCHIVKQKNCGHYKQPHNEEWKELMLQCGVEPRIGHTICHPDISNRRVKAKCKCGESFLGPIQARRVKSGEACYKCSKCGCNVEIYE